MVKFHRNWVVLGLGTALIFGAAMIERGKSAADDAQSSLSALGASAQTVKSKQAPAKQPVAEKTDATPTVTSYLLSANEGDERIREALAKTTEFDFNDLPLREALAYIGKRHDIRIWIDERALTDLNITIDTPVTRNLENVSLKAALRLLLRPLQLTFRVDAGMLQVTSQTEYDNQLEVRIYPVGDLISPFDKQDSETGADFDSLIDVISGTIAPTAWDTVGGAGSMGPHSHSLIVSQTAAVHEQIEGLIRTLRKVRGDQQKKLGGPGVDIQSDERSESIEQALNKPIDWDFTELPLREAGRFIAKQSGIQVQFDERALTDLNITSDTPVTRRTDGIPLKHALRVLLRPLQLTYVIDDEVLSITTQTEADNLLSVRVYPVGDLLDCDADENGVKSASCDFDSLIDVITTTIAPTTWDTVGGPSNVGMYEGALALVISQTQEVHELVDSLFVRMRQARPASGEKTAGGNLSEDKNGLVTRVYALWQIGSQRVRHGEDAPSTPAAVSRSMQRRARADAEELAQFGVGTGGFGSVGVGGSLSEQDFVLVPPPGVSPEQSALLVRRFVEPESWKQPGVVLQAAPHRLVVRQTAAMHKKTQEFLQQLGPWREVQKGALSSLHPPTGCGPTGGFGGAFQVADDPFAPAKANADRDPFEAPATQAPLQNPFGPAPGTDPFGAGQPPRGQPAGANRGAEKAEKVEKIQGRSATAKRDNPQGGAAPNLPSAAEARIREQLATPTEMDFTDLPIRDAIGYLRDRHGIEIQFDEKWFDQSSIKADSPVSLSVKGISLRSALRLLLSRLSDSATFVVDDEVLLITTREGAMHRKSVRIYDVSDFAESPAVSRNDPYGPGAPQAASYPRPTGIQELVIVIERAIAPGTWGPDHGSGVVPFVRDDSALLVVHHSANVHDEIVDLLGSLREVHRRTRRAER